MRYAELTRRLRRLGAGKVGESTRHERWVRFGGDAVYRTVIARHQSQEVPAGTLHRILQDPNLTEDDLTRA